MRNLKITLAYDGTNYVGWQVQPNGVSIQAVLEQVLAQVTGESVKVVVAGRTDAGVHALGQVCNFKTRCHIPCLGLQAMLQDRLPADIVVRDIEDVAESFHATYSAKCKHYRYVVQNSSLANPFLLRYAYQVHSKLDVRVMDVAAQELCGTHDFRCFESKWPNKATSVRTVMTARVTRQPGWPVFTFPEPDNACRKTTDRPADHSPLLQHDFVCLDIVADGFLYNMVRAIMGTLLRVGRGYWEPSDVRRIIDQQDRKLAGETVPPHGLYLVRVDYPNPLNTSPTPFDE